MNQKPIIGITCGDLNGIGTELIIKTFADNRILEHCTPVIFSSNKVINFYRKSMPEINFSFQTIKEYNRVNHKQVNLFNCWEEEVNINPGQLTPEGGKYAAISLQTAVAALKQNQIDGLVTAPIHKKYSIGRFFFYRAYTLS
jgi:4-hydroxythreonine-4-phosphate dehydrogenase